MADLRPSRLAAELRDVLDALDDFHDTLNGIAADAFIAAEAWPDEKNPARKALLDVWLANSEALPCLEKVSARLRAIIVHRLDSAERLEGGSR